MESHYFNTGYGPVFQPIDIGHDDFLAVINPETAFWSLVRKDKLGEVLCNDDFMGSFREKSDEFKKEMDQLRFGLKPSAVYFNPTERCNLNCTYCYIPAEMRKNGPHMSVAKMMESMEILEKYFSTTVPEGRKPQIVFHGSEPLMNKDAVFKAINEYNDTFNFGIQTNATLLDDETIELIKRNNIAVGISLDGPNAEIGNKARVDWNNEGHFDTASSVLSKLSDYPNFSVICTITTENMKNLTETIDYFHENKIQTCMLNIIRCTQDNSLTVKPEDKPAAEHYIKALDRTYELYQQTGRKIVVANFANILLGIVAPTARRLMCDISPCGGGRCFFAIAANGDMFPCSEFVGLPEFNGGNIFKDDIQRVIDSETFTPVTTRQTEHLDPCHRCAIQHFCGAPCPAEAYTRNGCNIQNRGAFCEFYEEQTRYAFRLIADKKEEVFLYDDWDQQMVTVFNI